MCKNFHGTATATATVMTTTISSSVYKNGYLVSSDKRHFYCTLHLSFSSAFLFILIINALLPNFAWGKCSIYVTCGYSTMTWDLALKCDVKKDEEIFTRECWFPLQCETIKTGSDRAGKKRVERKKYKRRKMVEEEKNNINIIKCSTKHNT